MLRAVALRLSVVLALAACALAPWATVAQEEGAVAWEYAPGRGAARFSHLASEVAPLLAAAPGSWGLGLRALGSGETLLFDPDRVFPAASLYKLAVLAETHRQVAAGRLAWEERLVLTEVETAPEFGGSIYEPGEDLAVAEALAATIVTSDNGAALALVHRLGPGALNAHYRGLGMERTRFDTDAWTTARDQVTFFTALGHGQVVSAPASRAMLDLLARQQVRDRIPAGLPPGLPWTVAHKTGNWPGLAADAGIVYTPHGAYALVLLVEDYRDYGEAVGTFRAISALAYGAFTAGEDGLGVGQACPGQPWCVAPGGGPVPSVPRPRPTRTPAPLPPALPAAAAADAAPVPVPVPPPVAMPIPTPARAALPRVPAGGAVLADNSREGLPPTRPGLSPDEGVFLAVPVAAPPGRLYYFVADGRRHAVGEVYVQAVQRINPLRFTRPASPGEALAYPEGAPLPGGQAGLLEAASEG